MFMPSEPAVGDPSTVIPADYLAWLRGLHGAGRGAAASPLGTASLIDQAAHRRAVAAMGEGRPVSLSRPLVAGPSMRLDGRPAFAMERFFRDGPLAWGTDHVELDCHGLDNTHLDGINHVGLDGTWYGGFPVDDPTAPSVAEFARTGIFTRGVHVDVPALRRTDWVDPDRPVAGADLEAALALAGVGFEPGDALLLDMGRDRFEASGHRLDWGSTLSPGIGADGARWIADHGVSVVLWDFQDSFHPDDPRTAVHLLNWAIGLVLVDNCDFARLRAVPDRRSATCAVVIAPPPFVGATGANVNPIAVA